VPTTRDPLPPEPPLTSARILDAAGPEDPRPDPIADALGSADADEEPREPLNIGRAALFVALVFMIGGLILTLLGSGGIGPGAPADDDENNGRPQGIHAQAAINAVPASYAIPAALAGTSGTMWVGPQAVSVSVSVSGPTSGVPHPCVINNGPDAIAVVNYSITDARHTLSVHDRVLARGGNYCWAKGNVKLPARLYVTAVDQNNGAYGKLTLTIKAAHKAPVHKAPPKRHKAAPHHRAAPPHHRAVAITVRTAAVQRAIGVPADGIWGPVTQAAIDRMQARTYMHYGVDKPAVRRLQLVLGVPVDGLWGPWTNSALFVAKLNAHS
jgi:hypothetical protein